jgi:uncharacterized protein YrrD
MFGKVGLLLRTFSLLKGQPVFDQIKGSKIGEVCDLAMTKGGKVKGLLVKKGVLFKQIYFLAIENVASFGCDGVMINGENLMEKLKNDPEYTFAHQHSLSGKMLVSKSGDTLGLLQDVYFQEELGTIVGYEVTDGFFSDISEGNLVIQTETPPTIGLDAIIVDVNNT